MASKLGNNGNIPNRQLDEKAGKWFTFHKKIHRSQQEFPV